MCVKDNQSIYRNI